LLDYHVHSKYSVDAEGDLRDHCQQALAKRLLDLGFADHLDFEPRDAGYGYLVLDRYLQEVAQCREEYAGRLNVRCGLEVGELHRYWPRVKQVLRKSEGQLDYLIGSVHWYNGNLIGGDRYRELSPRARYAPYFAEVLALVEHGGFQILGHLDVVSRYPVPGSPLLPEDHQEAIRAILRTMVAQGIVPEINVSGLRRGVCSFLPPRPVLQWYRELGGCTVALGSDAHGPTSVGALIPQAVRLARDLGFRYMARFQDLELVPLPLA
jgi:histidinol-phosphatase (PHP family)